MTPTPENLVANQSVIITLAEYHRLVQYELLSYMLAALLVITVCILIARLRRP